MTHWMTIQPTLILPRKADPNWLALAMNPMAGKHNQAISSNNNNNKALSSTLVPSAATNSTTMMWKIMEYLSHESILLYLTIYACWFSQCDYLDYDLVLYPKWTLSLLWLIFNTPEWIYDRNLEIMGNKNCLLISSMSSLYLLSFPHFFLVTLLMWPAVFTIRHMVFLPKRWIWQVFRKFTRLQTCQESWSHHTRACQKCCFGLSQKAAAYLTIFDRSDLIKF